MLTTSIRFSKIHFLVLSALLVILGAAASNAPASPAPSSKIYAQKLIEETLAAHQELDALAISATPPGKTQCVTIASDEAKEIGEDCDEEELTAMKTNSPLVQKEMENGKDTYDVTIPIHDASGKVIATAGIDFDPDPNQSEAKVTERAQQIAKEIEAKVPSKEKLFAPAS